MQNDPLPQEADLRKLAQRGAVFKANVSAASLPRFEAVVVDGKGSVAVDLELGIDEQRIRFLQGTITCETSVICQRCMEPMPLSIHADVHLGIVWDEIEAQQLPKAIDPLVLTEDELVNLNELVEEELLLNMPFVSYHEVDECSAAQSFTTGTAEQEPVVAEKVSPFSVLESLKSTDK